MIDVRLQSLKPPAIQYASVQPQSTLRMTSRMGCCVLGQGFYPRSCFFLKSELLSISEAEGSSTCVGDIGSPLMMPEGGGRFFSQVLPSHRICLIWIFYGNFYQLALCSSEMWKSSQAGLLSWSLGCGREEAPTVFTRSKSCKTLLQQVPHIFQQVMILFIVHNTFVESLAFRYVW